MRNSRTKIAAFIILFSIGLFSCQRYLENPDILKQAQELAESDPQRAIILIDSIADPQDMSEENYMKYIVTKVQIKNALKQNIADDTLIFKAHEYFDLKGNSLDKAHAYFYSGSVSFNRGQLDRALGYCLEAKNCAILLDNSRLVGRSLNNIAMVYFSKNIMDSSIVNLRLALNYYDKSRDTDILKMQSIHTLSSSYCLINSYDSAYVYLNKGLLLAKKNRNNAYEATYTRLLGVVYRGVGNLEKATACFHTALSNTTSLSDSVRVYFGLSKLYNQKNEPDSSAYYLDLTSQYLSRVDDTYVRSGIFESLAEYNKQIGNYAEALHYTEKQKVINQEIAERNKYQELFTTDKKVALHLKDRELMKEQAESVLYILGIILLLVLVALLVRYIHKQEKQESLEVQAEIDRLNRWRAKIGQYDSNTELYKWARNNLEKYHPFGKQILIEFSRTDILLIALTTNGYPDIMTAAMLDLSLQTIKSRKAGLKPVLKKIGLSDAEIENMLSALE